MKKKQNKKQKPVSKIATPVISDIPACTVCRNCGAQMIGHYCSNCGQNIYTGVGQPIMKFIAHYCKKILQLSLKYLIALKYLIIRPGFLTEEYYAGRIKKYVHPTNLFWIVTIIFFTILVSQKNISIDPKYNTEKQQTEISTTQEQESSEIEENLDKETDNEKSGQAVNYFSKIAPFVAFPLIPVLAFLLFLFFRQNKIYFIHHIVLSTHFYTFLWLLFIFLYFMFKIEVSIKILEDIVYYSLLSILVLMPGVYLGIAIKRFYKPKAWWVTVWKTIVVTILHYVLAIFVYFLVIILFDLILPLFGIEFISIGIEF